MQTEKVTLSTQATLRQHVFLDLRGKESLAGVKPICVHFAARDNTRI